MSGKMWKLWIYSFVTLLAENSWQKTEHQIVGAARDLQEVRDEHIEVLS